MDFVPANDAHLVERVRSVLGRDSLFEDSGRINVSSCKFVITLHGSVRNEYGRRVIQALVREVKGVRGVENKLKVQSGSYT